MPQDKYTDKISSSELDRITIELYKEFYDKNKELFKIDRSEYFHQARLYVERHMYERRKKH